MIAVRFDFAEMFLIDANVTVSHILGSHITDVLIPHEGKIGTCGLEGRSINGFLQVILHCLPCIGKEPGIIQLPGEIIFRKIPFTIRPHFRPIVVAPLVMPIRGSCHAGGNAHGTESISQDDGQPGAGSHVLAHGFKRRLVRLLTLRIVIHQHLITYIPVDGIYCLKYSLTSCHVFAKTFIKVFSPGFPLLVQANVWQDLVQENTVRHRLCPRILLTCLISVCGILQQEICLQLQQVPLRHISNKERHALFLVCRGFRQGFFQLGGIGTGFGKRLVQQRMVFLRHARIFVVRASKCT